MQITDEMVERAAEAIWTVDTTEPSWQEALTAYADHIKRNKYGTAFTRMVDEARRHARAALTAALGEVEPLEDALSGLVLAGLTQPDPNTMQFRAYVRSPYPFTPHYVSGVGYGPTIDAAVRNAVANAKGGQ